ncbi:MAG: hypothetical protein AB7V46_06000 [Thermomicrobiales bacterium]
MCAVGILCDRVRVEEKELLEALRLEGLPAETIPPTAAPLPIPPEGAAESPFRRCGLLLDRCRDRTSASFLMSIAGDFGLPVISGGVAATGNRLDVARVLSRAGIPRPATLLASSEEAGLSALRTLGYPATLFSLSPSKHPQPILDEDIAESLLEHRHTLLAPAARTMLVQAGSPAETEIAAVVVVDGVAVASAAAGRQALREQNVMRLAEDAARALGANMVGVHIAERDGQLVIWDIDPVPDFRGMVLTGPLAVGSAVATLARTLSGPGAEQEAERDVALSV